MFQTLKSVAAAAIEPVATAPVELAPAKLAAAPSAAPQGDGLELVEADVLSAIGAVGVSIASARAEVAAMQASLAGIRGQTGDLASAARDAAGASAGLARQTGGLASSSERITGAMTDAAAFLDRASERGVEARALIASLAQAGDEIAGIVDTISAVASQTSLLALNATIEAARAGEAGRGFAVVAKEVKALSVQTAQAVDDVRSRVARLREGANSSGAAIEMAASAIDSVRPAFSTVRGIADEQAETVSRIVDEATRTSELVSRVSGDAGDVSATTLDLGAQAAAMERAASNAADQADGLGRRFVAVIRQSEIGDRRRYDRYPTELPVRLADGRTTRTVDVSEGGVLIAAPDGVGIAAGRTLALDIGSIGEVAVHVVNVSPMGLHCAFDATSAEAAGRIRAKIAEIEAEYAPLVGKAQDVAARIAGLMEEALASGALSEGTLFDTDYALIEGSDPKQYMTAAVAPLERLLSPTLEAELAQSNAMMFCIVADRNGFVPVHNLRVSQPQKPGEPVWNNANCRNRRIFDDRTGITAARSTRPATVQAYRREIGDQIVMVREVDAPIRIRGRHWGAARTAYRL